jgi:hypothetical protein
VPVRVERLEGREVSGQVRVGQDQLIEVLGLLQVLEAVGAQVTQRHARWQRVLSEHAGGLREQHLPAVSRSGDPRRAMHVQAHVADADELGRAGVQPHAYAQRGALGPSVRG